LIFLKTARWQKPGNESKAVLHKIEYLRLFEVLRLFAYSRDEEGSGVVAALREEMLEELKLRKLIQTLQIDPGSRLIGRGSV